MDFPGNTMHPQVGATVSSPAVDDLKMIIEKDPELLMLSTEMFTQIRPGLPNIANNLGTFIFALNNLVRTAPTWSSTSHKEGYAGCPFTDLLRPYLSTPAGYKLFVHAKVNETFHKVLRTWANFLSSSGSTDVLTEEPNGWFSPEALAAMPDFEATYAYDRSLPHWGFHSWDAFFTRKLRDCARPIADPENSGVITGACDSTTYRIAKRIKDDDEYWVKDQPYSLRHLMNGDPIANEFIGGTIYQGYLEPVNYHRWHAPVAGKIIKCFTVPGTICSIQSNRTDLRSSQAFATHVATRTLIFIENEKLGIVGCLFAGLMERGSCEATVKVGQRVSKGQEIGMFHYGGSTHCLIMQPATNLEPEKGLEEGKSQVGKPVFHWKSKAESRDVGQL